MRRSGEAAALTQPAQPIWPSPGLPARSCRASPPGAAALTGVHTGREPEGPQATGSRVASPVSLGRHMVPT